VKWEIYSYRKVLQNIMDYRAVLGKEWVKDITQLLNFACLLTRGDMV